MLLAFSSHLVRMALGRFSWLHALAHALGMGDGALRNALRHHLLVVAALVRARRDEAVARIRRALGLCRAYQSIAPRLSSLFPRVAWISFGEALQALRSIDLAGSGYLRHRDFAMDRAQPRGVSQDHLHPR